MESQQNVSINPKEGTRKKTEQKTDETKRKEIARL